MANSDHEDLEVSTSIADAAAEWRLSEQALTWYKNPREKRHRRYTVSHTAPPAPPSTPTLLTATHANGNVGVGVGGSNTTPVAATDNKRLNHFIYLASSRNLRRETRCTDAELAELFNVVSITNRFTANNNHIGSGLRSRPCRPLAERGIRNASRTISKLNGATKIFKIHRNPKEFLREPDEDSVSAPEEYDTEEEESRYRPFWRYKTCRRMLNTRRERRLARFEHQERMETIVDSFDSAMNFNNA